VKLGDDRADKETLMDVWSIQAKNQTFNFSFFKKQHPWP